MDELVLLTREVIETEPWIGVQRAQVTALLERAEKAEKDQKVAYGAGFKHAMQLLDKAGYIGAADYLNESVVVVDVSTVDMSKAQR
jgi:hypothetical protein